MRITSSPPLAPWSKTGFGMLYRPHTRPTRTVAALICSTPWSLLPRLLRLRWALSLKQHSGCCTRGDRCAQLNGACRHPQHGTAIFSPTVFSLRFKRSGRASRWAAFQSAQALQWLALRKIQRLRNHQQILLFTGDSQIILRLRLPTGRRFCYRELG